MSRSTIYFIETGRSRPSLRSLQLISRRTGKPISYFLPEGVEVPEDGLAHAVEFERIQVLLSSGDFDSVAEIGRKALKHILADTDRARVDSWVGQALVRAGRPDEALEHLLRARAHFEAAGDIWNLMEALDWLAGARCMLQTVDARITAEQALELCRRLDPVPRHVESRILGRLASILVSQHRWEESIATYRDAREAAGTIHDLGWTARMYSDLSISYRHLGHLTEAAELAAKAVTLHEALGSRSSVARAENNLGLVLISLGRLEDAESHLRRSLAIAIEEGLERGRSHVLLTLAELFLARSDLESADRFAVQAVRLSDSLGEKALLAAAHEMRGKIAAVRGDAEATDEQFWAAITLLDDSEHRFRRAQCQTAYAEALELRGDVTGALLQWKLAMRASGGETVSMGQFRDTGEMAWA